MPNRSFVPSPRAAVFGLLGLAVFALLLLALPLAQWFDSSVIGSLLGRKKLVAAAAGLAVLLGGAWILWRRQYHLVVVGAYVGAMLALVLGVYAFQKSYPFAEPFSGERLRDNAAILMGTDMVLSKVDPKPLLKQQHRTVERAAFPAIDVHFHLESLPRDIDADQLIKAMDAAGVQQIVNLGGIEGSYQHLNRMFEDLKRDFHDKYPDRIIMFVKPDPGALRQPGGMERDLAWLKRAAALGARGVKENKSFGLSQQDAEGKLVAIDDERMAPVWNLAGQLGWPVLIHTGEPRAFWQPIDEHNERLGELIQHPQWSLLGRDVPSLEELMAQRERLLARHPGTNFIGAHFGMNPDDLQYAARLLDTYPNYYLDMSSVVSELGRQPFSTRRFFMKYQDRILFGTDGGYGNDASTGWPAERMYRSYFEFLETDNEYVEYPMQSVAKQGTWRVYGLALPADVLEKIYVTNAQRLIPTEDQVKSRLAVIGE
jgi:predicted TIM-barrel fold metal-dependent hydrolase